MNIDKPEYKEYFSILRPHMYRLSKDLSNERPFIWDVNTDDLKQAMYFLEKKGYVTSIKIDPPSRYEDLRVYKHRPKNPYRLEIKLASSIKEFFTSYIKELCNETISGWSAPYTKELKNISDEMSNSRKRPKYQNSDTVFIKKKYDTPDLRDEILSKLKSLSIINELRDARECGSSMHIYGYEFSTLFYFEKDLCRETNNKESKQKKSNEASAYVYDKEGTKISKDFKMILYKNETYHLRRQICSEIIQCIFNYMKENFQEVQKKQILQYLEKKHISHNNRIKDPFDKCTKSNNSKLYGPNSLVRLVNKSSGLYSLDIELP